MFVVYLVFYLVRIYAYFFLFLMLFSRILFNDDTTTRNTLGGPKYTSVQRYLHQSHAIIKSMVYKILKKDNN